ncbi:MAG: iron ABC transporter substrate-binding protein [Bacteroidota bacterium]
MPRLTPLIALALLLVLSACQPSEPARPEATEITLYAGRSASLVEPIVEQFEEATGITVNVRQGGTSALAVALLEEGEASPADVFWAQDGGALGAVHKAGLFMAMPDSIANKVPAALRNDAQTWVATSGRARTLAYAPDRVDASDLPTSIFDLTEARYQGRVGWAPTNGSFQSFVTAMRVLEGDERTKAWLEGMAANGAVAFTNNSSIIQGIADGEADMGLPNHYYLIRFKDADNAFPVEQTYFEAGNAGNLVNVAGMGVLSTSQAQSAALRFVSFMLSDTAQEYFGNQIFEYPVTEGVMANDRLVPMDSVSTLQPTIDLEQLDDLDGTLNLLREAGLI